MAKIRFKCTCGKMLGVDEQHAGKIAKCPACKRPVKVPTPEDGAAPDDAAAKSAAGEISSLSDAYGAAVHARARGRRVKVALEEYDKKARKRKLIVSASIAGGLLVSLVLYKLLQSYGPSVGPVERYPEQVQPFLAGLRQADPRVRAAAAWEVGDAGGSTVSSLVGAIIEPRSGLLTAIFGNEEPPLVKLVAARVLGRIDKANAPQYLLPLLEDDELDVRMTAALALAENGQDASSGLFGRPLGDEDWFVRFAAVKGLSALDPKVALAAVRSAGMEAEENEWVRRAVARIEGAVRKAPAEEGQ